MRKRIATVTVQESFNCRRFIAYPYLRTLVLSPCYTVEVDRAARRIFYALRAPNGIGDNASFHCVCEVGAASLWRAVLAVVCGSLSRLQ